MANAFIACTPPAEQILVDTGSGHTIGCSDLTTPYLTPVLGGLNDLAWNDANLLVVALLTSCCIAVGWNIVGKVFYRG